MSLHLATLWQYNVEFSILLLVVLVARFLVRKTTRVYNAYLLWSSIPIGVLLAGLVSFVEFSQPPIASVNVLVTQYVVAPATALDKQDSHLSQIWFWIALALVLRLLWQHIQLRRRLASITVPINLPHNSQYRLVGVIQTDFSPAVYGFFRPTIYFPIHLQSQLSNEQIRLILAHEEQHIRQCHLWLNLTWDLAVCLLWFNPLVYLARQSFRHDQELFCDYLVLNRTAPRQHQSYGHALLTTVSATHSVSLLCSWKSFNQLEERIMNIRKSTSLTATLLITLAGMLIVAATSVYAASVDGDHHESRSVHRIVDDKTGKHAVTVKINDKVMHEENGVRFVSGEDGRRPLTNEENAVFNEALTLRTVTPPAPPATMAVAPGQEGVHVEINDLGEQTYIWHKNGLVYTQDKAQRYVLDDGRRRALTREESVGFEAIISEVNANLKVRSLAPRVDGEKRNIQIDLDLTKQGVPHAVHDVGILTEEQQRAFEYHHEAQQKVRQEAHQKRVEFARSQSLAQREEQVLRARKTAHERQVMQAVMASSHARPQAAALPMRSPQPIVALPVSILSDDIRVAPIFHSESVPN
ncbi:hypothetical protein GCM10008090_07090 [Arenicella chitinivorans]|uniref:Peptidase M56 domain-containing protein n=1 Tax=Arenicella chitinivorans TaxID=1329800 RepID=A0A918VJE1_9GAMM|nr:M56 family metallopeptidase [Arenicella chitinivorans]GHA00706.1 hypothetical protein GCM10008090_07090 [Arenicella chitinivorans]